MRGRNEFKDVMDFIIVEAIDHFKAAGVKEVSLGNAPLANVDVVEGEKPESREERAVKLLFDKFYGYKSPFNFKKKYLPDWQGRYLAYRPRVGSCHGRPGDCRRAFTEGLCGAGQVVRRSSGGFFWIFPRSAG